MSEEDIRRYTLEEIEQMLARGEDRTDWARVNAKTEQELEADIASDPDWADIPLEEMLHAVAARRRRCEAAPVVVDAAVTWWFSRQGGDYATRINEVLRDYVRRHSAA